MTKVIKHKPGFTQHHFPMRHDTSIFHTRNFSYRKNGAGFTLIELLVVIAVIGLLASIVLVSLNSARAKARDVKRRADLKQLVVAVELYYDTNGSYPSTSTTYWGSCPGYGSHGTSGPTGWIPNIAPTYIPQLPLDYPKSGVANSCYLYISNGIDYRLLAYQTTESVCPVPSTDPMYAGAPYAGQCTFAIGTPGAAAAGW